MSDEGTQTKPLVKVVVDKDRMCAWLQAERDAEVSSLTEEAIRGELEQAKVAVDEKVNERIKLFVKKASEAGKPPERFRVAEGTAPVEPKEGYFKWSEELSKSPFSTEEDSEGEGGGQVDYRSMNFIRTVESGTVLGEVFPPTPGIPGRDVLGNELHPRAKERAVELQANVSLREDGRTAVADAAGRVVFERGMLRIEEVLEIRGDVDYESGNVDSLIDVHVRGTVRDLFKVASEKSIMVDGAVEAAEVRAAENLVVGGGILGRGKGLVLVDGEVMAKFCNEADLRAGGDITVEKEVINSRIWTEGRLSVQRGSIIGGNVYAKRGLEVRNLGSDSSVATHIRVGVSEETLWRARQIEEKNKKRMEAVEHIRQMVEPLMRNVKRLSGAQKERATELLFQAETMEDEIREALAEREKMLAEGIVEEDIFVLVQGMLYQQVTVAIGDRATTIKTEIKGPVKIELRKFENVTEFAAVDQTSGSVAKLSCKRLKIEDPNAGNCANNDNDDGEN
jgi:hypothetical protein